MIRPVGLAVRSAPPATIRLEDLYAPVARELEECTRVFGAELASDDPHLALLFKQIERYRGKQLRPALLLLAARACGELTEEHPVLAAVVEMVHIATLVHDDVLDNGDLRRGMETVNRRFGDEHALLLGDILFSHAYRLCSTLESQFAAQTIAQVATEICAGEMQQIAHRGDYDLSESTYLEIVTAKTAALIGVCGYLGARFAGAGEPQALRMRQFGRELGVAFQITDDLLDLVGDEGEAGKSLRRDAEHGELTLPLIHFLREADSTRRTALLAALRGETQRGARIAQLLNGSASVAYAWTSAQTRIEAALGILNELPPSDARDSLRTTAEFVLARRY